MSTEPLNTLLDRAELAVIEQGISTLRERAQSIEVKDQQGYLSACNLVLEGRSYIKDVKSKLGVGIDSAKRHLETLRNQLTGYVSPVEEIVKIAERKAEGWKRAEREAAQREQDEINRQAREAQERLDAKAREEARERHAKIPAPTPMPAPVIVAPSIPKVAGIKARVNWKFRIVDETKIPRMYCTPNEVAIGQMVRTVKDKAKVEALIPGIEAYSEDGI